MAHFYLLLSFLLMMTSEARDATPVTAYRGEDVVLPCFDSNMPDQKSCHRVRWIKYDMNNRRVEVILAPHKTKKAQDAGRVRWTPGENGHMSLVLTKLQESDEGLYSCEIWEGWDSLLVKNISLKVKECKTVQLMKALRGTTVELNCPVNRSIEEKPRNVDWFIVKAGNPAPLIPGRGEINGSSLAIYSVSSSDSSWYRCEYKLGKAQRCFEFNLQVNVKEGFESTVKPSSEAHSGGTTAVVAPVVTGIAVVAAVIGLFMFRGKILQRFAQQPQSCLEDAHSNNYETVVYRPVDVCELQANSIYEPCQQKYHCKERESSSKGKRQNKGEL